MMKFNIKFSAVSIALACAFSVVPQFAFAVDDGACILPRIDSKNGVVELNPACTYFQSVTIAESNTHLNCRGATIDGQGERGVGVLIGGRKKQIQNVTVENCRIQNFKNRGISITSGIRIKDFSSDRAANYAVAPNNVVVNNVTVLGSGRGGVYFDSYVTDSVLSNSRVEGSGKVGVYLEQATQRIKIVNNVIQGNGTDGRREGMAIDSSAHNTVTGNKFIGNAGGGILIYKNCGENFASGKSALRWQSSDFNVIKDNTFESEPVGVWIASRQSKDLSKWGCGDPAVDQAGRYYEDHANNNTVEANSFCGTKTAIRVEGNNNTIAGNRIGGSVQHDILEPYKSANKPDGSRTQGNKIESNSTEECAR